jgi:hypothetical protein
MLKRRAFLAGLLPLIAAPRVLAAPEKSPKAKAKSRGKSRSAKSAKSTKSAKTPGKSATPAKARTTVLDAAHPGSSATRLPPVKAFALPKTWRTLEVRATARLVPAPARQRLWMPLPLTAESLYQRSLGYAWRGNFEGGRIIRLPDALEAFQCEWPAGVDPEFELTMTVSTADRRFDISRRSMPPERDDLLRRNLEASRQIPADDETRALAQKIVGRIVDPVAQAHALFNWILENARYDAQLPPASNGDVRRQIATQQFGGRSAEISGLFVALCRAIGIPARRVFGQRIAPSRIASCLGIDMDAPDAAQTTHCRAEFYVPGYRWIPVDPSDVLRATTLETLPPPQRVALGKILFGVWEMNWMAYNAAEDPDGALTEDGTVGTPPAKTDFFTRPLLLVYPEDPADTAATGLTDVAYSITSREL